MEGNTEGPRDEASAPGRKSLMGGPGSGSIEEKIEAARALFEVGGVRLREDVRVRALLERLDEKIRASLRVRHALRVVQTCRRCEEQEGGSCCGAGIENRYDGLLLLINLLLGATLPERRTYTDSCYFLHAEGCCLKARHVLCVNYLCGKLQRTMAPDDLITLQAIAGEELDTGFALYEAIKTRLRLGTGEG